VVGICKFVHKVTKKIGFIKSGEFPDYSLYIIYIIYLIYRVIQ